MDPTVVTADARMSRAFFSDLFLLDLTDGGRVIAERCPKARSCAGKYLSDLADDETLALVRRRIQSYELEPMVLSLTDKVGIFLPYGAPSGSLGILLAPTMPRRMLLRSLRREGAECFFWQDALLEESERCRFAETAESRRGVDSLRWEMEICSRLGAETVSLQERIYDLSCLVGCPISVTDSELADLPADLDHGLCDVLLLTSFLLCRRLSADRTATVLWEKSPSGGSLCVRLLHPAQGERIGCASELTYLRTLSERKRIPFDYVATDLYLTLNFRPTRMEWSYLGIKQPEEEKGNTSK